MKSIVLCTGKEPQTNIEEISNALKQKGYHIDYITENLDNKDHKILKASGNDAVVIVNDAKGEKENYISIPALITLGVCKTIYGKTIYLLNDYYEPFNETLNNYGVIPLRGNIDNIGASININKEIKEHIEKHVLPCYDKNDSAHNRLHVMSVIGRSLSFASRVDDVDYNMVYVIAAYHDIGHYIDQKHHESIAAEIFLNEDIFRKYFNDNQIRIIAEAIRDHRASLKNDPHTIYGKILASADRSVSVEDFLRRAYEYTLYHNQDASIDEITELSRNHTIAKYGENGYATKKMYFQDDAYQTFLKEIAELANDPEAFKKRFYAVNKLDVKTKTLKKDN